MFRKKDKTPPDPATAQNSALRSLGRREHSAAQLKAKLEFRGYDDETVEQTVEKLTEKGWQSDARYAELLVRSRVAQGYGPVRIEAELSVAGIPDAEIAAALDAAECNWTELAQSVQQRKFGSLPENMAERHKQYRYLAGRGFAPEQIFAVLRGDLDAE